MADMIQIRRDTAANWSSANPVLAQGELGAETDTKKIKMGDGLTAWDGLDYLIDTGDYITTQDIAGQAPVQSVNTQTGAVVLTKTDVGLSNVDNVSAADLRDRSTHTGTQALSTISDAGTIAGQDADSVNIDGGNIDGAAIGANSADEGNFTTLDASGDVNFDSGTLFVDASVNSVGIGETSPGQKLEVNGTTRVASLGVGTNASATTGEIRATNNITAYYSDDRLKTKLGPIDNALEKVCSLEGFYYEANETAQQLGYEPVREVGVSAQELHKVLPEIVVPAPIDEQYLTVRYERIIPLLIEAIKDLKSEIEALKEKQND